MRNTTKNRKLICSLVVMVILFVLLLSKENTQNFLQKEEPTPSPTPELPLELNNVWLLESEGAILSVLYDGERHSYTLSEPLQTPVGNCIADMVVEKGNVTRLTLKNDTIEAKVLRIGQDFIELEGYGKIPLENGSRVYQLYDEIVEKSWQDVLVGYTTSSFVLTEDKICAALIKEPVAVTGIRVLIQTSSYGGYYHESLECGSEMDFYISDGSEQTKWFEEGEKISVTPEMVKEYGGRVYLGTAGTEGKISLFNVRRAVGVPSYRGTLEVTEVEGKLLIVNELSLEEYLYGVLPSEMPESFGAEALKAQAVCARSYACNQLLANRYAAYGAHVDDSMACQVYQNYGESNGAVEAVKATFGKILSKDDECITAYYFSCSYGHTTDSLDVWGENAGTVLGGVCQSKETQDLDLTQEGNFKKFLQEEREWYDEDSVWFRWNTVVGTELDERILQRIKERQKAVPELILVKTGESAEGMRFEQKEIEEFGTLEDIFVVERGDSGIINKLLLVGSKASCLIQREYNIRYILAPMNTVYLKDGSTTSNMNLLPSAYFTVEKQENHFYLQGGGYGHGVGMSQYGARHLAAEGISYEEILMHYYSGTELQYMYQ